MKKIIAACSLLLLGSVVLGACGNDKKEETKESEPVVNKVSDKTLNIGILPAESALPIILAKEEGFFKKQGLDVDIKTFSSPNDRNVAIQAKEIDGTISDVMTEATFKKNGINMTITSGILEDFKVLTSPQSNITDIKKLDGKKVTLVPNFILEYIMDEFAARNSFTYEIVDIPSFSARSESLMSGKVDAAVYTEPQASMLAEKGAHIVGSSKEAGIKGGTIQFMDTIIKERPNDIKAFYNAYNEAIEFMNSHDAKDYAATLSKYQFPEEMADYINKQKEDYPHASPVLENDFNNIIKWAIKKKQINEEYAYKDLTNFSFLK